MAKKTRFLFLLFCLCLVPNTGHSQTGETVYNFLNLGYSPRVSALGGINVSSQGMSPDIVHYNPAFLTAFPDKSIQLSYVNYYAGINYGNATFVTSGPGNSSMAIGILFLNYGTFTAADPIGNITGEFRASEYAFNIGWGKEITERISVGVNLKPILSHLEEYTSLGLAFDFGTSYRSSDSLFTAGLTLRNVGFQITKYAGDEDAKLPLEITLGGSFRLAHAPFRFSLSATHLETYDLIGRYESNAEEVINTNLFTENILRHLVFGVEFIPSEKFYVAGGFNYLRRKELAVTVRPATVGFSWGLGVRLPWFDLEYGRSLYHISGPLNNLSLTFNPRTIIEKVTGI